MVTDDSASNGEFLATTVGRTPDLVRLDIQIPGADGYATVTAMREHPTLAEAPIFAITAYAMEGDPQKGLDAGFTDY